MQSKMYESYVPVFLIVVNKLFCVPYDTIFFSKNKNYMFRTQNKAFNFWKKILLHDTEGKLIFSVSKCYALYILQTSSEHMIYDIIWLH